MKTLYPILFLLLAFVSCQSDDDFYEGGEVKVEQFLPVRQETGWLLSAKVSGTNFRKGDDIRAGFRLIDTYLNEAFYVPTFLSGSLDTEYYSGDDIWAEIKEDGTFEALCPFDPEDKKCYAFVVNAYSEYDNHYWYAKQSIHSDPVIVGGYGQLTLCLADTLRGRWEVDYPEDAYYARYEGGYCWSTTNEEPTIADNCDDYESFLSEDFAYVRYYKLGSSSSTDKPGVVYSNVVKYEPKNFRVEINTEEDVEDLNAIGSDLNGYRGVLSFHTDAKLELGSTLQCTIEGNGHELELSYTHLGGATNNAILSQAPDYYRRIYNYGTLTNCVINCDLENQGIITNCTSSEKDIINKGTITQSSVFVLTNYGTIRDCVFTTIFSPVERYYNSYIYTNETSGVIEDCRVETSCYLCCDNNGIIRRCSPYGQVCLGNNGIIEFN